VWIHSNCCVGYYTAGQIAPAANRRMQSSRHYELLSLSAVGTNSTQDEQARSKRATKIATPLPEDMGTSPLGITASSLTGVTVFTQSI